MPDTCRPSFETVKAYQEYFSFELPIVRLSRRLIKLHFHGGVVMCNLRTINRPSYNCRCNLVKTLYVLTLIRLLCYHVMVNKGFSCVPL